MFYSKPRATKQNPVSIGLLASVGAVQCDSPASVIKSGVDVLVAVVGYPRETEDVVYGANGLLEGN